VLREERGEREVMKMRKEIENEKGEERRWMIKNQSEF
jgi:hypothetical protein